MKNRLKKVNVRNAYDFSQDFSTIISFHFFVFVLNVDIRESVTHQPWRTSSFVSFILNINACKTARAVHVSKICATGLASSRPSWDL